MFILDEAHNAAPASATKYAIDSKLTRAIRDLTPRFEHKLFLSATPHNGHSNSFSALLEMLDPQINPRCSHAEQVSKYTEKSAWRRDPSLAVLPHRGHRRSRPRCLAGSARSRAA